jgi:hypothetical protein
MNIPLTSSYAGGGGIELSMTGGGAPSILWRSDTICKLNNAESGYQNQDLSRPCTGFIFGHDLQNNPYLSFKLV